MPSTEVAPPRLDADGNDDPVDTGAGAIPERLKLIRIGRHWKSLHRTCDLRAFAGGLISTHATRPLDFSGATVLRYQPDDKRPFTVLFDWMRPGEPTRGGGDGQGFLRARSIRGRLFVPDADPPYVGFNLSGEGPEGYVFVSDERGGFARQRRPGRLPPAQPGWPQGQAGAAVLPGAIHVLDVIRFREHIYASTGWIVKPGTSGVGSPAALQMADPTGSRWRASVRYPHPPREGVWRFTYLVRFRDRLYAGLQDFHGRDGIDYVVFEPPSDRQELHSSDGKPVRATDGGGARTLRWYADSGVLYWIADDGQGPTLRATADGRTWKPVSLPPEAGAVTDITRYRDALVVLTERGLFRLDGSKTIEVARIEGKKSPFTADNYFCAAPLAVLNNRLFAGGQRDGSLYEFVDEAKP